MKAALEKLYFFLILCSASGAISRIFGGSHAMQAGGTSTTALSGGDSDPVLFLFSAGIAVATCLLAFAKVPSIAAALARLPVLTALYTFAAVSVLWSDDRTSTIRGCAYLGLYLVSAAYLALRFDNEEIIRMVGNTAVLLALMSLAGEFLLPHPPDPAPGWTGVFSQKNDLGAAMAIGRAALIVSRRPWSIFRICSVALCSVMLVLSQAFTSVLAIAAVVFAIVYLRLTRQLRALFLITVVGSVTVLAIALPDQTSAFTNTTGKDLTLTGRTLIWDLVIKKITEHPILGYGYDGFWTTQAESINQFSTWKPGQAHNGYLDICLNIGVAGLLLTLAFLYDGLRRGSRLRKVYRHNAGVWILAACLLLIVRDFAEASFLDLSITWFVVLLTYFSTWRTEFGLTAAVLQQLPEQSPQQFALGSMNACPQLP
jgi:exopolysaccharide production protein ExoQ